MPIEYRIDEDLGIVRHEFTGEIPLSEFELYWERVLSDPSVPEPLVMMADMREWTRHSDEREAPVSAIAGAILGLQAFMQALHQLVPEIARIGV